MESGFFEYELNFRLCLGAVFCSTLAVILIRFNLTGFTRIPGVKCSLGLTFILSEYTDGLVLRRVNVSESVS